MTANDAATLVHGHMNNLLRFTGGVVLACACVVATPNADARATSVDGVDAAPMVRVTVVRSRESTARRIVLLVRIEGVGLVLGSYQGRLRYDPSAFVVDSSTPGRDGSRYVNAADASSRGWIRFAGFTTTGFTSTDAVRIVGHAVKPLAMAHIAAKLDVAGDLEGKPVPKSGLVAATTVAGGK